MQTSFRRLFPFVLITIWALALYWAIGSFSSDSKADLTFDNNTEVATLDPAIAEGQPEGRVINALFEGLLREEPSQEPDADGVYHLELIPGCAELPEVSEDQKVYTFKIREEAQWNNKQPITAEDFRWSFQRLLHPGTGGGYAKQLHYIVGAKEYNTVELEVGSRVEVELMDRAEDLVVEGGPDRLTVQGFPRGTIKRGIIRKIYRPKRPEFEKIKNKDKRKKAENEWETRWLYEVEVLEYQLNEGAVNPYESTIDWTSKGETFYFTTEDIDDIDPEFAKSLPPEVKEGLTRCHHVLLDFGEVGLKVLGEDRRTFEITLKNPTPFFKTLMSFYTMHPVNRECVEKYGTPVWTKPENIVNNGPFNLEFRRIRDRLRLRKNENYWNKEKIALETIDVLALNSETTSYNMFENDQIDWATTVPSAVIPTLRETNNPEFRAANQLSVYFYRVNVAEAPMDNKYFRQALFLAIDRQSICDNITKAGQRPTRGFLPFGFLEIEKLRNGAPYMEPAAYVQRAREAHKGDPQAIARADKSIKIDENETDPVKAARWLLALAGYPEGKGVPKFTLLYNTSEGHKNIAVKIQDDWKQKLGIDIELENNEWQIFLDKVNQKDYQIARAGWIADYNDPNSFLDMLETDGPENNTNWSHEAYDKAIADAQKEPDEAKRMEIFFEAEKLIMDELPFFPIYSYVSVNLVKERVKGVAPNLMDKMLLYRIRVEK
ncbi:MAG: peptide ABC transporter substrate-binding protein [Pirellulaceae bacterium]|nr:peptide ABC transporter substrate-binding protein [Pirellulaceae bacterium]